MSQIFKSSANAMSRVSIILAVVVLAATGGALFELIADSTYATRKGDAREQPIPFSHAHHVGSMGIDCRYCHTSVENSDFAVIPPTKTCMNCHSQIWINSPTLEPVRESFRTNTSIKWTKVYDLPDFVYFNHSIHVKKGVGCETCHGRIDQMALTYQKPVAADALVPRLPSQSRKISSPARSDHHDGIRTIRAAGGAGRPAGEGIPRSKAGDLLDMPQIATDD